MPTVSIIIPTYNRAYVIRRAIQSVLGQTVGDFELIIVDDASSDDTIDVVQSIADPRISVLRHSVNRGGADARNTGILNAKGSFTAFLDSDDTWDRTKLERQLEHIKRFSEPVLSYTQVIADDGEDKSIKPVRAKAKTESIGDYLFLENGFIQTSTILLSTALAQRTLFTPELRRHQDWDFYLRLEKQQTSFELLESPLTVWYTLNLGDRVSDSPNYHPSVQWVIDNEQQLSLKARLAFKAKYLALMLGANGERLTALKHSSQALVGGAISVSEYLKLVLRILLPTTIHRNLKRLLTRS